ncbi:MAG TPA: tetratricopeptide repeat protein [Methylocella sp.]|nr:tetratricopeptide repeat protein [Methylocella sp.]
MKRPSQSKKQAELSQGFQQAVELFQQGRPDQAAAVCKAILTSQPKNFDALNLLGAINYQLGQLTESLNYLSAALKLQPSNLTVLSALGLVNMRLGHAAEALKCSNKVLAFQPKNVEVLNNRGNALMELNRFGEALVSFDKGLALRPNEVGLLNNRGNALRALNRPDEALAIYDRVLALKPNFVEALNNRGNVLADLKRFEDALTSYNKALTFWPDYAEAHNNRGNALLGLNRDEEALASFDKSLSLRPRDSHALRNRGTALTKLKRPEDALKCYDTALNLKPDYAEAYNDKGSLLIELGQFSLGVEAIETAIKLDRRKPSFYHSLVGCKRLIPGDPNLRMMEELTKDMGSFTMDERIELHFGLGKALADIGDHERSFQHLLDGNALKRSQIVYDESATLDILERTQAIFTDELIRSKKGRGDPSRVPIFILGMPRSGSTLVEQILASHPKVAGAGEIDDLWKAIKGLNGAIKGISSPEGLARLSDEEFHQFGTNYVDRIRLTLPDAEHVTNKTLENFRFIGLIHLALPNARIIHTRRDPIDTCLSCFSKLFVGNNLPFTYDLEELGRYYRAYEAMMRHWRRILPENVMLELRYEEVVADLDGQTRRILAHCDLEWDPRCLDFHRTERQVRTASKVQVRQPVYQSAVGRWRCYEPFLGPLLRALEL